MVKIDLDEDCLEKALLNSKLGKKEEVKCGNNCNGNCEEKHSKIEEISFHKGALNTLVGERNELFKMIQNVEAIMQAHIKRLEELGVKVQTNNTNKN